ncbi:uncharacterized protein Dwil_GK11484 [Drosophila willistoni]|uniref:RING-type domain-containing protein n=1 Tax=Drosophila willistoni TaxID=7260 RepID=B4N9F7_DROWI|nr:uncharacterized protein Dwil_GK11484 [Drosophila willistoni]
MKLARHRSFTKAFITQADNDDGQDDGQSSSVRLLKIPRAAPSIESYGFQLTRSKWDPYPWVCEVAAGTPAALCGLKAGDCILEVNDIDILGLRISEVSKLVKSQKDGVRVLCWNSGCEMDCDKNSICCAPMPTSLKRLSLVVDSMLRIVECPVCNLTITPPAMQCQNGHLLCVDCRIRSERCPVCRDFYTPRRALVAEQIYFTIANAFEILHAEDKLRQKLFGGITKASANPISTLSPATATLSRRRKPRLPTNKFLTKLLQSRAYYSLENLSQSNAATLLRTNSTDDFNERRQPTAASSIPTEAGPSNDVTISTHLSLSINDLQQPEHQQEQQKKKETRHRAGSLLFLGKNRPNVQKFQPPALPIQEELTTQQQPNPKPKPKQERDPSIKDQRGELELKEDSSGGSNEEIDLLLLQMLYAIAWAISRGVVVDGIVICCLASANFNYKLLGFIMQQQQQGKIIEIV